MIVIVPSAPVYGPVPPVTAKTSFGDGL